MNDQMAANTSHLYFGGADTIELVKKYGTPLYLFDEEIIRNNCKAYKKAIDTYYDGNGMVLYASKAFSCLEMYRIIADEKIGIDVVSGGEMYTALKSGFPSKNIFFHGNNKTYAELEMAVENGIGHIVIDDLGEIEKINEIAEKKSKTVKAMLRIKPGIDAHTHDFIKTGQNDSKFGFSLEDGEAMEAVKIAIKANNIDLTGFHCHIGSQIFSVEPFCLAAKVMSEFIANVKNVTGKEITELNLGGGFGIRYTEKDSPLPYSEFVEQVSKNLKESCTALNIKMPKVYIEPGRSIAGPAGITLYTVGSIKTVPGVRTYVAVDGGMADNPRYALYKAEYEMVIANKANEPKDFIATIAGKCCESGDLIGENVKIQTPESGDVLAVFATGAYNYSMSSNYNRIPRPPVVMVKNGQDRLVVKRETFEDIISKDI